MNIPPRLYAKAFIDSVIPLSKSKQEAGIKKFVSLVKKNGHKGRLRQIIREIENQLVKKDGGRVVLIESARPLSPAETEKIKKGFKSNDKIRLTVNPSLIAGLKIFIDGEYMIDNSLERKMQKMFSKQTA